jgi:hypothetical protein
MNRSTLTQGGWIWYILVTSRIWRRVRVVVQFRNKNTVRIIHRASNWVIILSPVTVISNAIRIIFHPIQSVTLMTPHNSLQYTQTLCTPLSPKDLDLEHGNTSNFTKVLQREHDKLRRILLWLLNKNSRFPCFLASCRRSYWQWQATRSGMAYVQVIYFCEFP